MKGLQQASLVQGPVLNCVVLPPEPEWGTRDTLARAVHRPRVLEEKEWPCTALCSQLFPSPGLPLLPLGEDRALLGVFLRSGCFEKHLPRIALREARSTARHIPRTCVCKDTISAHHPDSWELCLEEDECTGDCIAQMATVWGSTGMGQSPARSSGPD